MTFLFLGYNEQFYLMHRRNQVGDISTNMNTDKNEIEYKEYKVYFS